MKVLDVWPIILTNAALIVVVIWQPVGLWVYRRLQRIPSLNNPAISKAQGGGHKNAGIGEVHNITKFPPKPARPDDDDLVAYEAIKDEINALDPVMKTAARMLTLSHKPFLTPEEAMFYLDKNEEELEKFLNSRNIRKLHLTSRTDKWVVRRESLEDSD